MRMDIKGQKDWVISHVKEDISDKLDDKGWAFYYRSMHDYGMDMRDADAYAQLNTLFGYDIGAERALGIIRGLYDRDIPGTEICSGDRELIEEIAKENGFHFDFTAWPDAEHEPEACAYGLPECPPWRKGA